MVTSAGQVMFAKSKELLSPCAVAMVDEPSIASPITEDKNLFDMFFRVSEERTRLKKVVEYFLDMD